MNAMIPWESALGELFTSPIELLAFLDIPEDAIAWEKGSPFPLRVPMRFAQKMKKGDPNDPLLRQVLTMSIESQQTYLYSNDPLNEANYNPVPGLLHKYPSRVLITLSPSCAVHCRYCFRRHFPYDQNHLGKNGWEAILNYLNNHPDIIEVILSGGDPLMAKDATIQLFLEKLSHIQHIQLLRIHTRFPVVIPERINANFVSMLSAFRFTTTMVYHINHPSELCDDIRSGVGLLKKQNISVLNQGVLLKGINDSFECLKTLSLALFKTGILPYYMHLPDKVQGTAHFNVSDLEAKQLHTELLRALPGYLVPRFVREIAGESSKIPL